MTRKDYIAIAEAIRLTTEDEYGRDSTGLAFCASRIAHVMAADNPRFDRDKFLKACGF
jgi:hypothetical protein